MTATYRMCQMLLNMSRSSQPQFKKTQFSGLDALILAREPSGSDLSSTGQTQTPSTPTVVLLHGFGADYTDLAGLAQMVEPRLKAPLNWIFLNAPHSVEIGPHMQGRAWFPLRLAELEASGFDFENQQPDGMVKAVDRVTKALAEASVRLGFQVSDLVLGGFSQGAMIASHVAAKSSTRLRALTLFSGALVDQKTLLDSSSLGGLPFFQSHGENDPLLEFEGALRLEATLIQKGAIGALTSFRGGHEIPAKVLGEWCSWLNER